jgi:hypothetical protein
MKTVMKSGTISGFTIELPPSSPAPSVLDVAVVPGAILFLTNKILMWLESTFHGRTFSMRVALNRITSRSSLRHAGRIFTSITSMPFLISSPASATSVPGKIA